MAGSAVTLMVLIVVTTAHRSPFLHAATRDRIGRTSQSPGSGVIPSLRLNSANASQRAVEAENSRFLGAFGLWLIGTVLLIALLWMLTAAGVTVARRIKERRAARDVDEDLGAVSGRSTEAVRQAVIRATEGSFLEQGTPHEAVVGCWVRLERAVADAGVIRRPSETSAELTIRVLDALTVDVDDLRTLERLYRTARFSDHPMSEQDRQTARASVTALRAAIRAHPRVSA